MPQLKQGNVIQKYIDVGGQTVGVHICTLLSASDTLKVPKLANSTSAASVSQLRMVDAHPKEAAVTVANSDVNTVTLISGVVGNIVVVVTLHAADHKNYGDEGGTSEPAYIRDN